MTQLAFLDYLELDDSADERAIRRAYARKLKLIDQETEAAGFQALREAYGVALQWARWQQQQAAPQAAVPNAGTVIEIVPADAVAPAAVLPVAESASEPEAVPVPKAKPALIIGDGLLDTLPPEEAARAVFNALVAELAASSSAAGWSSDTVHHAKLQRCLDDPRLLSIAARDIFEWYVAELLAGGWRPGQEALLVAATRVFAWQDDPQRLLRFGWVGDILNRAIIERLAFDQQEEPARKAQRDLIARLRDPASPSHGELIAKMPLLESTLSRFPNWLPLITSMEQLRRWRELDRQVPHWRRRLSFQKKPVVTPSVTSDGFNPRWLIFFLIMITIRLVGGLSGNSPPPSVSTSGMSSVLLPSSGAAAHRSGGVLDAPVSGAYPYASSAADAFRADPRRTPERVPVLPAKAQLSALAAGQPTLEKCDEIARLTQVFKIGTAQAQTRFSPAFERQVIHCANAHLWPRSVYQDPAVQEAVHHEEQRSAATMKSVPRQMESLRKVSPPVDPRLALPAPEKPVRPAREPGLNGVLVAAPSFRPVEQNGSLPADPDRYQLNAKGVQLKAGD